ncbi:MAG: hypothetical protein NC828_03190, partial [Candidatus Omnitrophica bacterium]|nr:hypothetical protein [Candidatus Omnitrophota bacterium]
MREALLFILPILIIVAVALTIFGIFQVRFEEEKLLDDLKRKAISIAESMELSVRQVLLNADTKSANYLVEKFESRKSLQGCVIYDKEGKIFAITKRFSEWKDKDKSYLSEILDNKTPKGEIEKFKEYSIYSYIMPVVDEERNLLGLIEVIYDTSYVFARLTELWRRLSITLILLLVLIAFIALLIQRQIFILPVKRLTEWFQHFQKGETDE